MTDISLTLRGLCYRYFEVSHNALICIKQISNLFGPTKKAKIGHDKRGNVIQNEFNPYLQTKIALQQDIPQVEQDEPCSYHKGDQQVPSQVLWFTYYVERRFATHQ